MAGSPRKRARKLGLPIPNLGTRPPGNPRARAPARVRAAYAGPMPSFAQMLEAALRRLLTEQDFAGEAKDRIAAARVVADITRSRQPQDPWEELAGKTDEELRAIRDSGAQGSGTPSTQ